MLMIYAEDGLGSITIGYHRLYSHRSFRAGFGVRMALAVLGASGFQGSIKVRSIFRVTQHQTLTASWTLRSGGTSQVMLRLRKVYPRSCAAHRCLRHRLHHVRVICMLEGEGSEYCSYRDLRMILFTIRMYCSTGIGCGANADPTF